MDSPPTLTTAQAQNATLPYDTSLAAPPGDESGGQIAPAPRRLAPSPRRACYFKALSRPMSSSWKNGRYWKNRNGTVCSIPLTAICFYPSWWKSG